MSIDPATEKFTSGGFYFCDIVKDGSDGLWKISKWVFQIVWTEGNRAVLG